MAHLQRSTIWAIVKRAFAAERLLLSLVIAWALLAQAACGGGPAESGQSDIPPATLEAAAATLTAWPTPPPLITRPPTATPAPQPLWTALPETTTARPTPFVTPASSRPHPVRLLIPRLALDLSVVEVGWTLVYQAGRWHSEWQTADGSAGHHRNSANPGESGNVVISGHHNTRGEVFRKVSEIGQPGVAFGAGDEIVVTAEDGQQYTYSVVRWERFAEEGASAEELEQHAQYLAPTQDPTLTLITCWPYESNAYRVVVVAKLVP